MSWGELKDKKENTEVGTWKLKVAKREREREVSVGFEDLREIAHGVVGSKGLKAMAVRTVVKSWM